MTPELSDSGKNPTETARQANNWTLLSLTLFCLGFLPMVAVFAYHLWEKPQYQFFPLAMAGAGFLIWTRIKEAPRPLIPGQAWVTVVILFSCFSILAIATAVWSPWLGTIAAFFGGICLTWMAGGWKLSRSMFPAFILLAILVPPPLGLDTEFTLYLRSIAVTWSSSILDTVGVIHCQNGNIIELPEKKLMVEEACSGINSVLFVSSACLFYSFWRRRSFLRVLIGLAVSIGFVLFGNVIRITLGAWFEYFHHINLLSGWKHELLGLVLLATYLGLIISFDDLMSCIPEINIRLWPAVPAPSASARPVHRRVIRLGTGLACLFALIGLAEVGSGWRFYHQQIGARAAHSMLSDSAVFTLPEKIGVWSRLTTETAENHFIKTQGISSKIWVFRNGQIEVAIAFDYPFRGYHDVRQCYTEAGWSVVNTERIADPSPGSVARIEVLMQKVPLQFGQLWFSTVDELGKTVEAPEFQRNFLDKLRMSGAPAKTTYRFQALVTGFIPLSTADRVLVIRLFEDARKEITKQLVNQTTGKP